MNKIFLYIIVLCEMETSDFRQKKIHQKNYVGCVLCVGWRRLVFRRIKCTRKFSVRFRTSDPISLQNSDQKNF